MNTRVLHDYEYIAAGRLWRVPALELVILPDNTEAITEAEIDHVHRAISNEICGSPDSLTIEELDFLCDVTRTTSVEVARSLHIHKSTLSKWRAAGAVPRSLYSAAIKKFFWFKLFGADLHDKSVKLEQMQSEDEFLKFAHDQAIRSNLAGRVEKAAA